MALASALLLGQKAAPKGPTPKSQKEVEAINAMLSAQDIDARIAAAEALLTKFADTEFKAIALQLEADAYQRKNDFEKMSIYAERTLEADPQNYSAMLMLANGIAVKTREFDLDKEEKLQRAEKYAHQAIPAINAAQKPRPDVTDEQWEGVKKEYLAQAHEALGLVAMVRKKYDVAVTEFKASVDAGPSPYPATVVRLAAAYNLNGKPDSAIEVLDKLNTMPDVDAQIKSVAQTERNNAMKLKSGGAKPPAATTPAPPAQVEGKKP